ncbi:hypothetical protein L798_14456 [Zootermopsis nevadensis]|uniref:Uncharacterized protein n=1 Tax=Zootermopsis nevadensis TaxID=136037 RepID=A0A067R0H1_ZOONE|nr:hypothetical protein L798_14456 [Zootermopsis nevadensis]
MDCPLIALQQARSDESLCNNGDIHYQKNNSRVMDLIHTFYDNAKRQIINELDCIKRNGKNFYITLDEWSSKRNHRYFNINVHHFAEDFNLGLVPAMLRKH